MTAKPSPFSPHVDALLSPDARRVLPRVAARSMRRYVPLDAIAPLNRVAYAELTGNERRAHLDRLALRLVAQHGPESASAMVLAYVDTAASAGGPSTPVEQQRTRRAPQADPAHATTPTDPALSGYRLPCALGCGRTRQTGSPLAQVWRCGNHSKPRHSRPRTEQEEA